MERRGEAPAAQGVARWGWYYGWNIVAVCILSRVSANALTSTTLTLFLRDWSAELHRPISQLQLPAAVMIVVAALASPLIGTLADRRPARLLFACGLTGMAVFYLAVSWVTAYWQLLLLYAVLAPFSLGFCSAVPGNALISHWFVRRLGLALGLCASAVTLGGVFLPPIIAWLLPEIGWRGIWRAGGILVGLVIMPLVVSVIRSRPTEREGLDYVRQAGAQTAHAPTAELAWRDILARPTFWLLVAVYLPMMALHMGCSQNLGPYAASRGMSHAAAGVLLSIFSVSHVAGTLTLGALSDRFGYRALFVSLAATMALGAVLLALGSTWPIVALATVLIGLGGAVLALLSAAIVVEFGPGAVGRAFGLCMFFLPLAAFAPFAIASVQESTGSYAPGFLGVAALVVLAGALSLLLRERRARHAAG